MCLDVHEAPSGGQAIADVAFPPDKIRQLSPVAGSAGGASVRPRPVFPADNGLFGKVNLLLNEVFGGTRLQMASARAGHGRRVEILEIVELVRSKRLAEMRGMAVLPAYAAFALAFGQWRLGLDDVGGGRL